VLLVFLLALRIAGLTAAAGAAASYASLALSPTVLGFAGHATHFVVLMAMAGLLLLLKALDEGGLWLFFGSGVFFGLAFLMKQPGLLLVIFGALYLLRTELKNGIDFSWAEKYVHDHYRLTGIADIHAAGTDYRWGDAASTYRPRSNSVVFVFMRSTP
jgi:predicted membrane-bound mannosyltransferase